MRHDAHIGRAMRASHSRTKVITSNMAAIGRPISKLATRQRGFSLVTAIFVLVVLAALGGYMVSISGTQHFTTLHALQGAKAYHAARSGIEWGIAQAGTSCSSSPTDLLLLEFTVAVRCAAASHSPYTEGSNTYHIFEITSLATTSGSVLGMPGYAARQITATITTD